MKLLDLIRIFFILLALSKNAFCEDKKLLDRFDRVSFFVCDQKQNKILERIKLKDNKLLEGIVPDHYEHNLFSPDFDSFPEHFKYCIIFQNGNLKHHEKVIVWIKKLRIDFTVNEFGEYTLERLLKEIEDKSAANRLRELIEPKESGQ